MKLCDETKLLQEPKESQELEGAAWPWTVRGRKEHGLPGAGPAGGGGVAEPCRSRCGVAGAVGVPGPGGTTLLRGGHWGKGACLLCCPDAGLLHILTTTFIF